MKYLDEIDALAKDIGSVNTVVKKGRSLIGYNTDGIGFYRDLVIIDKYTFIINKLMSCSSMNSNIVCLYSLYTMSRCYNPIFTDN